MEEYCEDLKNKDCAKCLKSKMSIAENIIETWQFDWHNFLSKFDSVIVPSKDTKTRIKKVYSDIKIDIIEHGVDLIKSDYIPSLDDEEFNVAFVGVMAKHKGGQILENLVKKNKFSKVKFHLFGLSESDYLKHNKSNYIFHGKYKREELPDLLKKSKINLICSLSVWPETYSYTLTEEIASGVPVLSFDIGAVSERIHKYKFGWTIDLTNSEDIIINKIAEIKDNKEEYLTVLDNIQKYKIRSTREMTEIYKDIYYEEKICELNSDNIESLRILLKNSFNKNINISSVEAEQIMNSLRWKLISKVKVPNFVKKMIKKVIK